MEMHYQEDQMKDFFIPSAQISFVGPAWGDGSFFNFLLRWLHDTCIHKNVPKDQKRLHILEHKTFIFLLNHGMDCTW